MWICKECLSLSLSLCITKVCDLVHFTLLQLPGSNFSVPNIAHRNKNAYKMPKLSLLLWELCKLCHHLITNFRFWNDDISLLEQIYYNVPHLSLSTSSIPQLTNLRITHKIGEKAICTCWKHKFYKIDVSIPNDVSCTPQNTAKTIY